MLSISDVFENVIELDQIAQWGTDPTRQGLYLTEETGEFVKELLKTTAKNGDGLTEKQKAALCKEGFDVIWNVCAVLLRVGVTKEDFQKYCSVKMTENKSRKFRPD